MVSLLLVFSLTQPAARVAVDCQSTSPAAAALREVAERIIAADNRRDLAAVMALYAQDAWLLPPMESPVTGHANIRPRYETLFSRFKPEIEGHIDDVCVSGALGFVRGHNSGRMQGRNGQPSRPVDDVYLMIVKLEADQRWRISQLMWHPPFK